MQGFGSPTVCEVSALCFYHFYVQEQKRLRHFRCRAYYRDDVRKVPACSLVEKEEVLYVSLFFISKIPRRKKWNKSLHFSQLPIVVAGRRRKGSVVLLNETT